MKKEKISLFLLITLLLSACSGSPEKPFSNTAISFTCPSGWTIEEEEEEDGTYYLSVEKEGMNSSGILVLLVFPEAEDLELLAEVYAQNIQDQGTFDNLIFGNLQADHYGNYLGYSILYTGSVHNLPHQGKIIVFEANGKTVCINIQEANEDQKKNQSGFRKVEETFKVL